MATSFTASDRPYRRPSASRTLQGQGHDSAWFLSESGALPDLKELTRLGFSCKPWKQ